MISKEEQSLNKVFNKMNEIQKKSDSRYKEYKEYIDSVEELDRRYKLVNSMYILQFVLVIVILIKVW